MQKGTVPAHTYLQVLHMNGYMALSKRSSSKPMSYQLNLFVEEEYTRNRNRGHRKTTLNYQQSLLLTVKITLVGEFWYDQNG